jgi:hypothetical protein
VRSKRQHEMYQCLAFPASPNLPRTDVRHCAQYVVLSGHALLVSRIRFADVPLQLVPMATRAPLGGGTGVVSSGEALPSLLVFRCDHDAHARLDVVGPCVDFGGLPSLRKAPITTSFPVSSHPLRGHHLLHQIPCLLPSSITASSFLPIR